ncbi:MAG: SDR family oxidoreductase [Verrucomicrobiota bacterium]
MSNYLIIASSSTIGQELVKILHQQADQLYLTSRNPDKIQQLADETQSSFSALDASSFEEVNQVFEDASDKLGPLDGVVCLAGSLLLKAAHQTSEQEYLHTIQTSLTTAFATTKAAGKHMRKGGSVVLISSAAAMQGFANHEAIAAAKGGVIALARSAAATYARQNLRFNVVSPGLTETALTKSLFANEASKQISEKMHVLGRLGEAHKIALSIAFLLNPENDWITGQVLGIDGGLSRVAPKIKG